MPTYEEYGLFRKIWLVIKGSVLSFMEDDAPQRAAALAFYSIFSLAPLLLITVVVAGLFLGRQAVQGEISDEIEGTLGEDAAMTVETLVRNAYSGEGGTLATVVSLVLLLFGATIAFAQLQLSLDVIWGGKKEGGFLRLVVTRLRALVLVILVAVVFLTTLVATTFVSGIEAQLPEGQLPAWFDIAGVVQRLVSVVVLTGMIALLFKLIPRRKVAWKDVWVGSAITAAMLVLGQWAVGLYLANAGPASAYGAAGSVVVILLFIYYASMIFYFGAELTHEYAKVFGSLCEKNPRLRAEDPRCPDPQDPAEQAGPEGQRVE